MNSAISAAEKGGRWDVVADLSWDKGYKVTFEAKTLEIHMERQCHALY